MVRIAMRSERTRRAFWVTVVLSLWAVLALVLGRGVWAAQEQPTARLAEAKKEVQAETETEQTAPLDAEEILLQVDRALQPESRELFVQLTNQLPNGRTRQVSLYGIKGKGNKSAVVVIAPPELLGRAVLRSGDEVWMHIPGELAVRKSSLSHALVGGTFNNADLLLTDFSEDYTATLLEERADTYLLALSPRRGGMPYAKLVMQVDRNLLLPRSVQQYGANGVLVKTIIFEDVLDLYGFPRPAVMKTESAMNKQYAATWRLGLIKSRTFPPEAFTKAFLPRVGTLYK